MTPARDDHVISNLELKESTKNLTISSNLTIQFTSKMRFILSCDHFSDHVIKDHVKCHKWNHMELSSRQRQETRTLRTVNILKMIYQMGHTHLKTDILITCWL